MSRLGRLRAESRAAALAFLRRRTAVFFTFFFPLIIVVIFGVLVQTRPGGGGLFTEPPAYYAPGYLAVVVLFTPLSRVGSEVARHRDGNRFEKLATTPLTRPEWLLAQTLVNVVIIGLAGIVLLGLMVVLTGAEIAFSPLLVPFVVLGVALFCGVGAMLGSLADSQDGVISASNGIALPLLFLSETFVPPSLLPAWLPTWLSPLTYFSRGVRAVTTGVGDSLVPLAVLTACAVVGFLVGARLLPRTD
ncbi:MULTISPECIES: ABC transporter permease [Haloarcula]|uniref:ABC transporter permease n=1 Tax=Haloarcula pellucida TaxID=1427151 RepID=A0A830GIR3_9EURY|nr:MULTISPECIES: ABC transporter permease [Halomicroarcula]MBX0347072.1 ABC transporter permease [Halomicroarcula pellucida]MDS0277053.1 ABC transporter permease [Halomicroarcula sp. S1AR25-4]GGN86857.1 ABC transporter permease [Halomicroarcula pellucida]